MVNSVLATTLVTGLTLAAIGASAHDFLTGPQEPAGSSGPIIPIVTSLARDDAGITVRLEGGASIDATDLLAIVSVNETTVYRGPVQTSADGIWALGDSIEIPIPLSLPPGARATVTLVDRELGEPRGTSSVIVPHEVTPSRTSVEIVVHAEVGGLDGASDLTPGQPFRVQATLDHPLGRKLLRYAYADLGGLGGSGWLVLRDDGTGGDLLPSDGVFGGVSGLPALALPGGTSVGVYGVDLDGNRGRADVPVTIAAVAPLAPPPSAPLADPDVPPVAPPPAPVLPLGREPDGALVPPCSGEVGIEIVGVDITYGADGPRIPVLAWYTRDDGAHITALYGGVPVARGAREIIDAVSGDVIGVRGALDGFGLTTAYATYEATPHVAVLFDGDLPPNVAAFGSQTAIEAYLAPYVESGRIRLAPNEAIALFEFTGDLTSSAADFQDLVVLFDVRCDLLGEPRGLFATPGLAQVELSWDPPSSGGTGSGTISGYRIYRGLAPGAERLIADGVAAEGFVDTSVTVGETYYYVVTALNETGEGAASNAVSAVPATFPDAPTLASATPGDAQVTLAWSAPASDGNSPITGYRVYRGTTSGAATLVASVGATLTYVDTGLTNGDLYYYQVSAINAIGEGPRSSEGDARPASAPAAPTGLSLTAGDRRVALTWTPPVFDGGRPITGYGVYRGTASASLALVDTLGLTESYTDTGLANGQVYYYAVSAINEMGVGARSEEANARPATTPSAPALAAASGDRQATLTWSASADGGLPITNYRVYRADTSGVETLVATLGVTTSFVDAGLTNGQAYRYAVAAVNGVGEGARSAEVVASPATVPGAPTGVAGLSGNARIGLSWSAPGSDGGSPITAYEVYRGTVAGTTTFLARIDPPVASYLDMGLTNGQTYYYRVAAVNAMGVGARSSEISARPIGEPTAPRALATIAGDGNLALSWMAPASDGGSAITSYNVYRGASSGTQTLLATVGVTTTHVDGGLVNGQAYYYKVSAVNFVGEGAASNEAIGVPATTPAAPAAPTATAGNARVTLTWAPPAADGGSPITGYRVYRGTSAGAEVFLAGVGVVTSYTDTGLTNGQTYYYKIAATNARGTGNLSSEASARPATLPTTPQNLTATRGNDLVTLRWSPPISNGGSPITGYKVYRSTASGAEVYLTTVGVVSSYVDGGLTGGVRYYYKMTAINSVGESPLSSEVNARPT